MPNAAGECNSRVTCRIDAGSSQHNGEMSGESLRFRRYPLPVPALHGTCASDRPRRQAARFAGLRVFSIEQRLVLLPDLTSR
jgi:hypothetical protein